MIPKNKHILSKLQKKESKKNDKTHLPKSQYDSSGRPILTIPNLDDLNLNKEMYKYLDK
jgi:hypothetical protein